MSADMPTREEEHGAGLHEALAKFDCRLCDLRSEREANDREKATLRAEVARLTEQLARCDGHNEREMRLEAEVARLQTALLVGANLKCRTHGASLPCGIVDCPNGKVLVITHPDVIGAFAVPAALAKEEQS